MSDDVKPEVLPGDLITRPGLYESRSRGVVEVQSWCNGYWVVDWDGDRKYYYSSGKRTGSVPSPDPYELLHWVGPVAEDIPTTSEQIAEIEEQAEPEQQPVQVTEAELELRIRLLKQCNDNQAETIRQLNDEARDLRDELARVTQTRDAQNDRIGYLETMNAGQTAAVKAAGEQNAKLRELATNAGKQLEQAAEEISELRRSLDDAEKQLDQKDAQIRDLRIELEAAQEAPQPVGDEEREQIWNQATEQAGQLVIQWLRPLTQAMITQPDDRLCRFMAMTLSILPDILPHVLGYAEDDESLDSDGKPE